MSFLIYAKFLKARRPAWVSLLIITMPPNPTQTPSTIPLTTLVQRARQSDLSAFCDIVQRFDRMAFAMAMSRLRNRQDAQDATQEAFLEAFRSLGQLNSNDAFTSWFILIVRKHINRFHRKRKLALSPAWDSTQSPASSDSPPTQLQVDEHRAKVRLEIMRLPERLRLIVMLHYVGGYPHRDIARFLKCPVTDVNNALASARRTLERRLKGMNANDIETSIPDGGEVGDRITFLLVLADGLAVGKPVSVSLQEAKAAVRTPEAKQMADEIFKHVMKGGSLSGAIAKFPQVFPQPVVDLFQIGEIRAILDITVKTAVDWLKTGKLAELPPSKK